MPKSTYTSLFSLHSDVNHHGNELAAAIVKKRKPLDTYYTNGPLRAAESVLVHHSFCKKPLVLN